MTRVFDPFRISGPAAISFSGGRTSAYMLYRILEANDGGLPANVRVFFANTGKEHEATLQFVHQCSVNWNVPVTWLEYESHPEPSKRFRVVSFETASRNGEPFSKVIDDRKYLPNVVTRFCTSELKVKVMSRYIVSTYGWEEWTSVIGIRADEPRRVARLAAPNRDRDERYAPLAVAGITVADVVAFWQNAEFDLGLDNDAGVAALGNCDLCFLKGQGRKLSIIQQEPHRALWWMEQERKVGARFRSDRASYADLLGQAVSHGDLYGQADETVADCFCDLES